MRVKQKGASAVELALVLPLFLLLIDGVIEFSLVMYDKAIILNAARVASRSGTLLTQPKLSINEIIAIAKDYSRIYLVSFSDNDAVHVIVNQSTDGAYQTPLTVTVTYTYTSLLAGSFLGSVNKPLIFSSTVKRMNE
jgi:Flp pilus assembly protein TadG